MIEKFQFLKRKDGAALLEFVFCFPILFKSPGGSYCLQ